MKRDLRPEQRALLGAGLLLLASWFIPFLNLVFRPLQLLYTHLHELGHALVAFMTGASNIQIEVSRNGSGMTTFNGGWYVLISPAGYLGATVFGAVILLMSKNEKGAKTALAGVGAVLLFSAVFWLRGDAIGLISGIGYGVLFVVLAASLKGGWALFVAHLVGLQQCLASLQAVLSLLSIGAVWSDKNDSQLLADHTGVPAIVWAGLWAAIGVAVLWVTLRRAWRGQDRKP